MTDVIERSGQDEIDASKAPLLDHLVELRTRLISSLIALGISFVLCFIFAKQIYNILVLPYLWAHGGSASGPIEMIYTAPQEFLFTQMKLALFGAFCLVVPHRRQPDLQVRRARPLQERAARLPALSGGDAAAVPARRPGRLFPRHADGDALLPVDAADGRPGRDPPAGARVGIPRADHEPDHRLRHLLPAAGGADAAGPRRARHARRRCARGGATPSSALPRSPPFLSPPDPFSMLAMMLPTVLLYEVSIWAVAARSSASKAAKARQSVSLTLIASGAGCVAVGRYPRLAPSEALTRPGEGERPTCSTSSGSETTPRRSTPA